MAKRFVLMIMMVVAVALSVIAQPKPEDIYKEFWADSTIEKKTKGEMFWFSRISPCHYRDTWWLKDMPLTINDLEDATRAELVAVRAEVLPYTKGFAVQLNNKEWHVMGYPDEMSKDSDNKPFSYESFTTMTVPIDLSEIQSGLNTFKMKIDTVEGLPPENQCNIQNYCYGVAVRVYYKDSKAHPVALISTIQNGQKIIPNQNLTLEITSGQQTVKQVDYIGFFEDWNVQGDNVYNQWQYYQFSDSLMGHIGHSKQGPNYPVKWNNIWTPDQSSPFKIAARITTTDGTMYWTPAVEQLSFNRLYSVKLYKPYDCPPFWNTKKTKNGSYVDINGPNPLTNADSARALWTSWGYEKSMNELYSNGKTLINLSDRIFCLTIWDATFEGGAYLRQFAANKLNSGKNQLGFKTAYSHGHGVSYPGIAIAVRYNFNPNNMASIDNNRLSKVEPVSKNVIEKAVSINGRSIRIDKRRSTLTGKYSGIYITEIRTSSGAKKLTNNLKLQ